MRTFVHVRLRAKKVSIVVIYLSLFARVGEAGEGTKLPKKRKRECIGENTAYDSSRRYVDKLSTNVSANVSTNVSTDVEKPQSKRKKAKLSVEKTRITTKLASVNKDMLLTTDTGAGLFLVVIQYAQE